MEAIFGFITEKSFDNWLESSANSGLSIKSPTSTTDAWTVPFGQLRDILRTVGLGASGTHGADSSLRSGNWLVTSSATSV